MKLPTDQQRLEPTVRPDENPIGFQRWTNLLFVHWRVPVEQIRDLIPERLAIDTFDGDAWIGLVPFYMSGVRPARLPAVLWVSNFCETNLRTYVHLKGKPGVWFFSLDASRLVPVLIARGKWHLNYHWSSMNLKRDNRQIRYNSRRIARDSVGSVDIEASIGQPIFDYDKKAAVDSLEFFLAERYLLFCERRNGQLLCGQVHHTPYPLKEAKILHFDESISAANRIDISTAPDHALFSEGVEVEIFPLRLV